VRPPKLMQAKVEGARDYWSSDSKHLKSADQDSDEFSFELGYDSLSRFEGTHPAVMQERLARLDWHPELSTRYKRFSLRYRLLYWIERLTGKRLFENRHFIEIKPN
jgi:hypothetical protein